MRQKRNKCLCLLVVAVLLFSLAAPAALAAETGEIHIRTAEDLITLAKNCSLDTWSQGKTICLEADINLTGTEFTSIPTFGGTFQGQGHTISGLAMTGSGNVRGLFRYIQPSGTVQDLTVEGWIDPSDRKNSLGGLAGNNRGVLTNCAFHGTVTGADSVGGLVGVNEAEGQIINCAFSGSVTGEHSVGGIAGQNFGTVIRCENSGNINTTEVDAALDLDDLNREQLNAAENAPVCTDIGGIAGFSTGILQSCVNSGHVGYAHVGYNIGGIVGRQSGYLDGCVNSGTVLGRKDVGGVAGQLEPEVRLLYNQGRLGELLDALDGLRGLMDRTRNDLQGSANELSERMKTISGRAEEAREAVGDLADSAAAWGNGNIDAVNSLSARLSWMIDELAPILGKSADTMDLAEALADRLEAVLDQAGDASDVGDQAASKLRAAVQSLRGAAASGREAVAHLQSALENLGKALGNAAGSQEAMAAVKAAADELASAYGEMAGALRDIAGILGSGGTRQDLQEAVQELSDALEQMGSGVRQAVGAVATQIDADALSTAGKDAEAALAALREGAQALLAAAGHAAKAAALLPDLISQTGETVDAFQSVGRSLEELVSQVSTISAALYDVFQELADQPTITIRPIDSTIQEQGDAVGDIFSELLKDGDALRETMTSASDTLIQDLEDINDQFGVITSLLRDLLSGATETSVEDRFEDISDQETGTTDTGCICRAQNTGTVEGDINVAGIVGSMAIEYDFDPEDDLIQEGDRSLDFRYQTKAVVLSCVNRGEVTGKRDYAGGVVGLMDLGRVSACENYGAVSSTDGDYVGGIAGASWGSIRDSWAKCSLSGGDYVGGVAGLGATLVNCHTLVEIGSGDAYSGAVAGDVDRAGTVSGNTFTSECLGAVDGISYTGKAEPVDFDSLCATPGAPEGFAQLELTFVADGTTVAVIPFRYGEGLDTLPEIPAKPGYSATWPELDYNCLTASRILEAEYTPYTSALTDGGDLPEILVDGSFSSRARVSHSTDEVSWVDASGRRHTGTAYTVTVDDPSLDQVSYTVHYRLPDAGKRYTLWVLEGEQWVQRKYEVDGRYLLLNSQENAITFCVMEQAVSVVQVLLLAAVCVIVLAGAGYYVIRRRRGRAPSGHTG